MRKGIKYGIVILLVCVGFSYARADRRPFLCEIGVQAGCGYYVGDATTHIFNNVREVYGAHFRYMFDQRWALQVKGLGQTIKGPLPDGMQTDILWQNKMINLDVMAEFNFFRFGGKVYDRRVKPYTPYIFVGVGVGLYSEAYQTAAAYIPIGIGFKWKFAKHWGLNIAWQHNIYFADNLENMPEWGNTYDMNGSNIFNNDLTGQLTLGIVFDFIKKKKICKFCEQ